MDSPAAVDQGVLVVAGGEPRHCLSWLNARSTTLRP